MSPKSVIQQVKKRYPALADLPKPQLKMVEKALLYARNLGAESDLLSTKEHEALIKEIGPKGGHTPGTRLRAYRLRQGFNQQQLADKSGISQANISAMEQGRRSIGLNVAKKLAKVLTIHYQRLL